MQVCGRCRKSKAEGEYSPSYRGKQGTWCRACFAEYNRFRKRGLKPAPSSPPNRQPQACSYCKGLYQPKQDRPSEYCSRSCKAKARNAALKAKRIAGKVERPCLHCGAVIAPERRADAKYCSEECNSAAHAVTRKMAQRSNRKRPEVLISRNYIGDRDGWRCKLCGKKVNRALKHPDPLLPSIDHLVPLSAGGDNELSNLQLAHLRCNLSKSARAQGEQLMAFG